MLAGSSEAGEICVQAGNLLDRFKKGSARGTDGVLTNKVVKQLPLGKRGLL